MKLQQTIPLSSIYNREEDFSADLADNLDALRIRSFEDVETEANLPTNDATFNYISKEKTVWNAETEL